ncbi:hypothetical protein [Gracilibacillus halophilus]|uniref:hypothetical protein n=1 Tax=Gracilibacillus halophilus TaxID=470864 RepID=UPI00068F5AC6|nr:hypothetical protein [Gracilibacillus halophilus]
MFWVMFLMNLYISVCLYLMIHKKRKIFDDRFSMILSYCISSVSSIAITLHITFLVELDFVQLSIVSSFIGGGIGWLFGSLRTFQSLLAGFSHGMIGGLMGMMLGAVIQDPSLCSLPAYYQRAIELNMVIFSIFTTGLTTMMCGMVYYAFRV